MYQKIIIVGRLGKDPEQRFTPTGQAVTSFPVATDRQYTDQGGQPVKETVWFRVTRAEFEKLAKRVAKLERENKPAPKKDPSIGIYYRDGKPCKRKPRNE